jgi:hypothetical protein
MQPKPEVFLSILSEWSVNGVVIGAHGFLLTNKKDQQDQEEPEHGSLFCLHSDVCFLLLVLRASQVFKTLKR